MKHESWKANILKLAYFEEWESPAPLNIQTPTPAPDRGGAVACLGGPVAYVGAYMQTKLRYTRLGDPN